MASSADEEETQDSKPEKKRVCWVHPYNLQQTEKGFFAVTRELAADPVKFQKIYRMKQETFKTLAQLVSPFIRKKDTRLRKAICPEERLLITLRYLATGFTFRAISHDFRRGESTIGIIVTETCMGLWEALRLIFMAAPTVSNWVEIAESFQDLWLLPNCVGYLDARYIRIRRPAHSGSVYCNSKGFYSLVLLSCVDANGHFTKISVTDPGEHFVEGDIKNLQLEEFLNDLNESLPSPKKLSSAEGDSKLPFYFIGNEAFPLRSYVMKLYPNRKLTDQEIIFNDRISKAMHTIDCAFKKLGNKFRVFQTPITCTPDRCQIIIQAACLLHNFIMNQEQCTMELSFEENEVPAIGALLENHVGRPNYSSLDCRDQLATHFMNPECLL